MPTPPGMPRRLAARGKRRFREFTARWRMLPELLIIGAQKAGTTSLYEYLTAHRQVLPGTVKEVRYFNAHYRRGPVWYRSHFPLMRAGAPGPAEVGPLTLDASTGYLFSPEAPHRVLTDLPNARFVVLLRDPVERAWSHYKHSVRDGHEELPFAKALAAEEARFEEYQNSVTSGGPVTRTRSFHSYKARGRYHEQLERWFATFDRSRFLVLRSEDFFVAPQEVTNQVLAYLGLSPLKSGEFNAYNVGSADEIPAEVREDLRQYFRPHNEKLYELLGWPSAWD